MAEKFKRGSLAPVWTEGERQYVRETLVQLRATSLPKKAIYARIAKALGRPVSSVERIARALARGPAQSGGSSS